MTCKYERCYNLKGIEYNSNCVTTNLFAGMTFQEVKIGDKVTTLYNGMFCGCTGLKKVTLGKGLAYIRNDAFKGCAKLDTVTCRAENPPYCYPDVFANVSLASCTLEVPKGAGEAYKTTAPWKEFGRIIEFMEPDDEGFYHLSTVDDVEWFSAMVNEKHQGWINAKLDNDIDFGGVPNAHQPIGTSNYKYAGHFDGQGHRILNMVITPEIVLEQRSFDGVGFFGSLRSESQSNWEVPTTGCIVENLIIDSSCSISYNNRWVGGIAGHIYGGNGSVTIRNCGNEANISATGDGCGGILGIVESTALKLNLIECWNTGRITSTGRFVAGIFGYNSDVKATINITNCMNAGDIKGASLSSAICGSMGGNTGTKISNCYNIGEISGMDRNLSLYRGTAEATNLYDISASAQDGKATVVSNEMVTSGELCYLLNGKQSDDVVWYQTLGEDNYPVPCPTSKVVYKTGEGVYTNDANSVEGIIEDESAEAAVYDLTGRRVQNAAKGLYIIKGRKVVVK